MLRQNLSSLLHIVHVMVDCSWNQPCSSVHLQQLLIPYFTLLHPPCICRLLRNLLSWRLFSFATGDQSTGGSTCNVDQMVSKNSLLSDTSTTIPSPSDRHKANVCLGVVAGMRVTPSLDREDPDSSALVAPVRSAHLLSLSSTTDLDERRHRRSVLTRSSRRASRRQCGNLLGATESWVVS